MIDEDCDLASESAGKELRGIQIYADLLRSTGIYSVAVIAERCASFLLLPLYTHYLSTTDYGTLELLNLTSTLVGMILGVRLGQALFFYYFAGGSERSRNEYISTAFIGALLMSGVVGCLVLPAAPLASRVIFGTPVYTFQFELLLFSLAASLPVEVGLSYMRVAGKPKAYVITLLIRLALGAVLNVVFLVFLHLGLSAILWTSLIIAAVTAISLAWYCYSQVGLAFSFRKLGQLFRYSLPLGISGIAMFVVHFCDRFFLRWNVSLAEIGIYALAYQLGWIVATIQLPFANYWNSQAKAILRSSSGERVYSRTCTYMILALSGTAVLLCVFARPMLQVMVPPAFRECAKYLPLLAGGYVLRALADFVRYILVLEKQNGWDAAITTTGAVTALSGYAFLIPRFKLWGAVEATVAAFVVMLIFGFWKAQRTRAFQYEYLRLAKIAACAVGSVTFVNVIHAGTLFAQIGAGLLAAMLFPLLLWLCGFTTKDERKHLRLAVSIVRRRLVFA